METMFRLLNALLDDLTRIALLIFCFVVCIGCGVFAIALAVSLLWNVAITGWMLGTFLTI